MTKYAHNKDFFAQDIPESFYWAGFIAADGCVDKKASNIRVTRLAIHLSKKDYKHLEKFKADIAFDGPIENKKYSCRITIHSYETCENLKRFNIIPRKTLIYKFPQWLKSHSLANHFMRGYFDGDGTVFTQRRSGRKMDSLVIKVCGTEGFVRDYKEVLLNNIPTLTLPNNIHKTGNISELRCSGNRKSTKVRDFLYKDAGNLKLDRKYDIFHRDIFMNMPKSFRAKKVIGTNIETGEKIKFSSMAEAAEGGFDNGSISMCCSNKRKSHKKYTWAFVA